MDSLKELVQLLKERNAIDDKISSIITRPALTGHIGEYIAGHIFNIKLHTEANHRGSDGIFASGILKGKSVNIKYYGKEENILDINAKELPDFYLVLTGDKGNEVYSKGKTRPFVIKSVFLFDAKKLVDKLTIRKVKIGVATSVTSFMWDEACIFPKENEILTLTEEMKHLLYNFS